MDNPKIEKECTFPCQFLWNSGPIPIQDPKVPSRKPLVKKPPPETPPNFQNSMATFSLPDPKLVITVNFRIKTARNRPKLTASLGLLEQSTK